MLDTQKCAVVIGASRGLGLGLVKEFLRRDCRVTATYRSPETAQPLLDLSKEDAGLDVEKVDINASDQVMELAIRLKRTKVDFLFVNAGISLGQDEKVQNVDRNDFVSLLVTNAYSPMQVIDALDHKVRKDGMIAVMSSDLGSIENNLTGNWEVYRASKASLNTLMKSRAATKADRRTYLCLSPGWVRTDMGGDTAPLDVATSASGLVDTMLKLAGSRGVQFLNYKGQTVEW
ncbi:SDR family NAD(P)-dependent oxidoreductase [Amylibacter sp.]|nr:SDR family NAD(P)-dependent oxidoreductase [Amylibacter sp.]